MTACPHDDDERTPTFVTCDVCGGEGVTRTEDGSRYVATTCELCNGVGCVTAERLAAWKRTRSGTYPRA